MLKIGGRNHKKVSLSKRIPVSHVFGNVFFLSDDKSFLEYFLGFSSKLRGNW